MGVQRFGSLFLPGVGNPQHRQSDEKDSAEEISQGDGNLIPEPPLKIGDRSAHPHTCRDQEHIDHGVLITQREEGEDGQPAAGDLPRVDREVRPMTTPMQTIQLQSIAFRTASQMPAAPNFWYASVLA
jgi:hypothetical protein